MPNLTLVVNNPAALALARLPDPVARAIQGAIPGYKGSELEARVNYTKGLLEKGFSARQLAQHLHVIHDARDIKTCDQVRTFTPHVEIESVKAGEGSYTEFTIPGVDLSKFNKFELVLKHPQIDAEIPLVQSGFFGARVTEGEERINTVPQLLRLTKPSPAKLVVHGSNIPGAIVPDSTAPNGFFRPLPPESASLVKGSIPLVSSNPYTLKILGDGELIATATLEINSQEPLETATQLKLAA